MIEGMEAVPQALRVLPDPLLFRAARRMQLICVLVATTAFIFALIPLFKGGPTGMVLASLPMVVTGMLSAASLTISQFNRGQTWLLYLGRAVKALAVFAAAVLFFWTWTLADSGNAMHRFSPPVRLAIGFVLLTIAVVLVDNIHAFANRAVDVLVGALGLLAVLLTSSVLPGRSTAPAPWTGSPQSTILLICLASLAIGVGLRQAERGVFSIFLGAGMGSRLARIFAPALILLCVFRETLRMRVAGPLGSALLGVSGVAVTMAILMFFAWRISSMENEIHDLILRDEATRLYNGRGFNMLAEHALRLAKRSDVPFSVLFIRLENLAQIHAELGPNASAASLAEAGEILRATFRESDIKGRIGAAEFAVAGRFDRAGICVAALRLEAATAARTSKTQGPVPLELSMGHVTTVDSTSPESIKDLVERAGQAKNRMESQLSQMSVN